MKSRFLSVFVIFFVMVSVCTVSAHAAYSTSGKFSGGNFYFINLSPTSASYSFYSTVSYEELSGIAVLLNSSDSLVNASVVFNSAANCYVVRVSTSSILGGVYGVVGSASGYVYVCPENATLPVVNRILGYLDSSLSSVVDKLDGVNTLLDTIASRMVGYYDSQMQDLGQLLSRSVTLLDGVTAKLDVLTTINNHMSGYFDGQMRDLGQLGSINATYLQSIVTELGVVAGHMTGYYDNQMRDLGQLAAINSGYLFSIDAKLGVLDTIASRLTGWYDNSMKDVGQLLTQAVLDLDAIKLSIGNISSGGGVDSAPIVSALSNLQAALLAKLDTMSTGVSTSIDNTVVNITNTSDKYNVFYVTDSDGNEKSVVSLSGDLLGVGGKLLDFLYKAVFSGALDNSGDALGNMSDFYLGTGEGSGDVWGS